MVGIASNLTMYLVYLLLTYLGITPKVAMTLLYMVGASVGFIGHRKWSFGHHGDIAGAALRYGIAHLLGYLINWLILTIFVDRLGFVHQVVQGVAIFAVAGFLFVAFKYFVFAQKNKSPTQF